MIRSVAMTPEQTESYERKLMAARNFLLSRGITQVKGLNAEAPAQARDDAAGRYVDGVYQHPGKSQAFNELDQFYRDMGM